LVLFFDEVRVCFELPRQGDVTMTTGMLEMSCNFKTTETVELQRPWVFSLRLDPVQASSADYEPRTWEAVDPNRPAIMGGVVKPADLAQLVEFTAAMMIAPLCTLGVQAPAAVKAWARPLPAIQQLLFPAAGGGGLAPQQVYLEMMSRNRALYVLPVIDT